MFSRNVFNRVSRATGRFFSGKSAAAVVAPRVGHKLVAGGMVLGGVTAAFVMTAAPQATECAAADPHAEVRKEIAALMDAHDEKMNNGTSIGPTFVRLAWHASGTYSVKDKTGGSNGATMRYAPEATWGANAGLAGARDFLAPVAAKYKMSNADVWTLAACVAIEHMGGPSIPWRAGRTDSPKPTTVPDGRLPAADNGHPKDNVQHYRDIYGRMGFNDREIVALLGAHAIGRCHTNASGYWGPWTRAGVSVSGFDLEISALLTFLFFLCCQETTFSNEYYRLLLEEKWTIKRTHEGKPWTGPTQYESADGTLMMLPTDIALTQDKEFLKYVQLYAKDEAAFFKDFSSAFNKLLELGVPFKSSWF